VEGKTLFSQDTNAAKTQKNFGFVPHLVARHGRWFCPTTNSLTNQLT